MAPPIRIGNAQGFWGDRGDAAAEMLAREPGLDALTLDYLAGDPEPLPALLPAWDATLPINGYDLYALTPFMAPQGSCGAGCWGGSLNATVRLFGLRLPVHPGRALGSIELQRVAAGPGPTPPVLAVLGLTGTRTVDPILFFDDFEWGDLDTWTLTIP